MENYNNNNITHINKVFGQKYLIFGEHYVFPHMHIHSDHYVFSHTIHTNITHFSHTIHTGLHSAFWRILAKNV